MCAWQAQHAGSPTREWTFCDQAETKANTSPIVALLGVCCLSFSHSFHIGLLCQGWRQRLLQQARALCKQGASAAMRYHFLVIFLAVFSEVAGRVNAASRGDGEASMELLNSVGRSVT